MLSLRENNEFEIKPCPILGQYNAQRFLQWSPEDAANFYLVKDQETKQPYAMYPTMGRAHVVYSGINQLIFGTEPRGLFKTIKYSYVVVGNTIYRVDSNYEQVAISTVANGSPQFGLNTIAGPIYFCSLVVNTIVFACFTDQQDTYIYREDTGLFYKVTDPNAPGVAPNTKPGFIVAFGNRIALSILNSSQFNLSVINLGGDAFDPATCFTINAASVFAQEDGIIRQMGVLNNTLYIFTDYTTGVWSNFPAIFSGTGATFPWKKNTTWNWNFGIANPTSLDIDFGMMVFLAQNTNGLLQFMVSTGGQPTSISSKAINTLLQKYSNRLGGNSPFLSPKSNGFLYQYEDTIFYRMSGGYFDSTQILDQEDNANSVEYNFDCQTWHRCIEDNGNRNRINLHVYYNFKHLVTVLGENTVYEMSGQYYYNELRNPAQPDSQEDNAYIAYPFRYERVTPIIYQEGYAEFETEFVQIDFVWGQSNINFSSAPFANANFLIAEQLDMNSNIQYIIDENPDSDGQPVFILADQGNTPDVGENYYNYLFKPNVGLYWSDDGGISYNYADNLEFSQQGVYSWRMRWYQLGVSRNRVYRLVCVSPVPIVVLGSVMNVRRVSGGAY